MRLFKKMTLFAFEYSFFLVLLVAVAAGAIHEFGQTTGDCHAIGQLAGAQIVAGHSTTRAINLQ